MVDRQEALDVALGQIERQFGKGAVMKMNDHAAVSIGAVSTGSLALDLALGIGGEPRGLRGEDFGPARAGGEVPGLYRVVQGERPGRSCRLILPKKAHGPALPQRNG